MISSAYLWNSGWFASFASVITWQSFPLFHLGRFSSWRSSRWATETPTLSMVSKIFLLNTSFIKTLLKLFYSYIHEGFPYGPEGARRHAWSSHEWRQPRVTSARHCPGPWRFHVESPFLIDLTPGTLVETAPRVRSWGMSFDLVASIVKKYSIISFFTIW